MSTLPGVLDHGTPPIAPRHQPVSVQWHSAPRRTPTDEPSETTRVRLVEMLKTRDDAPEPAPATLLEMLSVQEPDTASDGATGRQPSRRGSARPPLRLPPFACITHVSSLTGRAELRSRAAHDCHRAMSVDYAATVPVCLTRSNSLPLGPLALPSSPEPSPLSPRSPSATCGIVPPLTPPEDVDAFKWDAPSPREAGDGVRTVSNIDPGTTPGAAVEAPRLSPSTRPSEIRIPERPNMGHDETSGANWLERACQHLVSSSDESATPQQLQMVVQSLPSRAKSRTVKPVFERVVEAVQASRTHPPYITITHAVSQVISMDEVPASPPATPNTTFPSDDYFQDQTIFTHAAVVPAYHSAAPASSNLGNRASNIIAAPSSIQISVLERCIPPSSPEEVDDFFTLSRRSYLADRLLELSSHDGALLLLYPTEAGGATFAHRYIGPVIEPFLRQFILLNGLFVDVAVELGRVAGVAGLRPFHEMKAQLDAMCETLGSRTTARGLPSRYQVVHAETTEMVLDQTLWRERFIEQEHPRLRQNLVDYHKHGGRMPSRSGQIEVTPSMLAREIVDGVRQSRATAGDAGVELAVFVIRRSIV